MTLNATLGLVSVALGIIAFLLSGSFIILILLTVFASVLLWTWRKTFYPDIQREFLSVEWDRMLKAIKKIVSKLHQTDEGDDYVFKYPITLNLSLLYLYQQHHRQNLIPDPSATATEVPEEELLFGYHFVDYAMAAYGGKYVDSYLSFPGGYSFWNISNDIPLPVDWLAVKLSTNATDIIRMKFSRERLDCPNHYIAVDDEQKAVILSVQNTADTPTELDWVKTLTDLACESVDFLGGKAHRGFKEESELLFQKTFSTICCQLNKRRDYSLIVTGHGLGAGISILLTILLLLSQRKPNRSKPGPKSSARQKCSQRVLSLPDSLKDIAKKT